MPIVPFTQRSPFGPTLPKPNPTFLMMAAAELHEAGRLVEPIEERSDLMTTPPKDAT